MRLILRWWVVHKVQSLNFFWFFWTFLSIALDAFVLFFPFLYNKYTAPNRVKANANMLAFW